MRQEQTPLTGSSKLNFSKSLTPSSGLDAINETLQLHTRLLHKIIQEVAEMKTQMSGKLTENDADELRLWAKRYIFNPKCPTYKDADFKLIVNFVSFFYYF
jgi:hypothetical protein